MQRTLKPTARQLLLAVVVILIVCILLAVKKVNDDRAFRVISTNPSLSRLSTSDGFINLNFNRPINKSTLYVSFQPDFVESYSFTSQTTLRIELKQPPLVGHQYTFLIRSAESTDGRTIKNEKLVFTGYYQNFGSLSKTQQQQLVNSQNSGNTSVSPITKLLPYYSTYYYLETELNGENLPNILFTYVPPPSFDKAQVAAAPTAQQALSQAETWLTQQGINITQYKIIDTSTGNQLN